nr:opioid growth factor receptor-related protein [Halomonas populi]
MWGLPSFWLEHTHDYIQWLFPIPEMGRFNAFPPLLTSEVQADFEREASLRQ